MKPVCFIFFVVTAAQLVGCSQPRNPVLDHPDIAVVRIERRAVGSRPAMEGRGFFVSADGLLVTSRHVVAGDAPIDVKLPDGRSLPGALVQEDPASDIAILRVVGAGFPVMRVFPGDIEPGLHVRVIGARGIALGSFDHWEDFGSDMAITAQVGPADAGSPLLADEGSVVGVVRGIGEGEPAGQRATPAWRVLRMMPMLGISDERK